MLASGYTSVAEFHYVHHRPDGTPYDGDEMGAALQHAAEDAGIRMALMDTCYLSSGFGKAPEGAQVRFSDGDAARWSERAASGPAAIHSVRAVPRDQLHTFKGWAPLHVHLSEQRAENEACVAAFPEMEPVPHATFEEAFEAIKTGACQLGMIPVENSIAGRVADVHHLLPNSGLKIIGERFKPIHFQLMANPGVKLEDVRTVASMPIALAQCRKTVRRLKVKTEPVGDTALAAKLLSLNPDPTRAAIDPASGGLSHYLATHCRPNCPRARRNTIDLAREGAATHFRCPRPG